MTGSDRFHQTDFEIRGKKKSHGFCIRWIAWGSMCHSRPIISTRMLVQQAVWWMKYTMSFLLIRKSLYYWGSSRLMTLKLSTNPPTANQSNYYSNLSCRLSIMSCFYLANSSCDGSSAQVSTCRDRTFQLICAWF